MKKVLIAANISESFQQLLNEKGYDSIPYTNGEVPSDVSGIVTSTKLKLDTPLLRQLSSLKWIARLGSGVEIIDVEFCKKNNISFASSPAGISNAVAEHCMAMLISLQKNIASSFIEVKNKQWIREPNRGFEISGLTIGLIGYGHTGQAFAQKLQAFDCKVLAYDKYKNNFEAKKVKQVSLIDLQQQADVISFHVPANDETKYYYDDNFIQNCKSHILINTSRGVVVKTQSLLAGLKNKKVVGAALDVLDNEHLLADADHKEWQVVQELLKFNTLITPHIAGYSYDAIEKMSTELMEKLKDDF